MMFLFQSNGLSNSNIQDLVPGRKTTWHFHIDQTQRRSHHENMHQRPCYKRHEKGERYPKKREVYSKLSAIFGVDTNYLLTENEEFITEAASQYGSRGKQQAEHLVSQISGLFAGGELSQADKDVVMQALQEAYWGAKRDNKEFTPKNHSSKD